MTLFAELHFDNSYARLGNEFSLPVLPTPLKNPKLVSLNEDAAKLLDLQIDAAQKDEFVRRVIGEVAEPNFSPVAMRYSGHQFGHYNPKLGDGRAILLGQVRNDTGELWDLHLKGAGKTPYSRGGDGRAVLRSSIREYLGSEALHALGIATSRGLCLISSEEAVYRETVEPGAMLMRLARTHVRFGSFEILSHNRQTSELKQLADYVIAEYLSDIPDGPKKYADFFKRTVEETAKVIAQWQCVGFAHGVLNTDNMSILGMTLDYGPFGFVEAFDPGFVCNHSDHEGRYAFGAQPSIGLWNLSCLGQSLLPLIPHDEVIAALNSYGSSFEQNYRSGIRKKLGLEKDLPGDLELWERSLVVLARNKADFTRFYRQLSSFSQSESTVLPETKFDFSVSPEFKDWLDGYQTRLRLEDVSELDRHSAMKRSNPKYILRNYLAEQAIRLAEDEGDFSEVENVLGLLRAPFDEQPHNEMYAQLPPLWSQSLSISCSS